MQVINKKQGLFSFVSTKLRLYTSKSYISFRIRNFQWYFVKQWMKSIDFHFDKNIKVKLYTERELSKLIYCNHFEKDEFSFMEHYIKPGFVVYDIGANIGLHSLYLSYMVGPNGRCYSFEPTKATFESLNENVKLNRFTNIETLNLALSDKEEILQIYKSTNGYDAWNSLGGFQKIGHNQYDLENVTCIPLDRFLVLYPQVKHPDFIKIDTEGWELHVLRGAYNLLKNDSPLIMMEYAQRNLNLTNTKQSDLYDYLTALGYKLYKYDYKKDCFDPIMRNEVFEYINIIASKSILH